MTLSWSKSSQMIKLRVNSSLMLKVHRLRDSTLNKLKIRDKNNKTHSVKVTIFQFQKLMNTQFQNQRKAKYQISMIASKYI